MPVVEKSPSLSATEMDRTVQRLAHEIVEKTGGTKDLALIGIRRRGVPLAQTIALAIRGSEKGGGARGHTWTSRCIGTTSRRSPRSRFCIQAKFPSARTMTELVLVDDVLYTGRTVRAAMNGLFDLGRPQRIRLCVLIDRGHRELPIEAAFVGRRVDTSANEIIEVRLNEIDREERVMPITRSVRQSRAETVCASDGYRAGP